MTPVTSITIIHASRRTELATWVKPVFAHYRRTDIIQDSYRADQVDTYYDHDFFCYLVNLLLTKLDCTQLALRRTVTDEFLRLDTLAEIATTLNALERNAPPAEVILYREHEALVQMISEPWAYVGGPGLYHDSFTYAILNQENLATSLYQLLEIFGQSPEYDTSIYYGTCQTR